MSRSRRQSGCARLVPRHREQSVAVDHGRHHRAGDRANHRRNGVAGAAETGSDHERLEPIEIGEHADVPIVGRQCVGRRPRSAPPDSMPGLDSTTMPAPVRCAGGRHQRRRRPSCRCSRPPHGRADRHLCASRDRSGNHAATSDRSTMPIVEPLTSRPMSATSTSPTRSGPAPSTCPGFSGGERDRRSRRASTPGDACPVSASTPARACRQRAPGGSRRRRGPRAPESGAERGIDHQVARRQSGREREGVEHTDGHPSLARAARRRRDRRRRCCPARRSRRPSGRTPPPISRTAALATAAPARSTSTPTGSGAAASIARISAGVTTGIMPARSLRHDVGDGDEIGVREARCASG